MQEAGGYGHFYQRVMCVVQGMNYIDEGETETIGNFIRHYCSELERRKIREMEGCIDFPLCGRTLKCYPGPRRPLNNGKMVVKCTVVECEMTYDIIVKYGMQQELDVLRRISHMIQYGDVFGAPLL